MISVEDKEWNEILEKLNLDMNIKNTGNPKCDYLNRMKELLEEINLNKYLEIPSDDNKKELISLLYNLGHMFYCFKNKVNKMNRELNLDLNICWDIGSDFLPTSHNYNAYLNKLTPIFYTEYYKRQLGVIEEFINNNGDIPPKYLYNAVKIDEDTYQIQKLELLQKDILNGDLLLPNYYCINAKIGTLDDYEKLFNKTLKHNVEECFERFKNKEYPVLQWIRENRNEKEIIIKIRT